MRQTGPAFRTLLHGGAGRTSRRAVARTRAALEDGARWSR